MDGRWKQLAEMLVGHSTGVRVAERVMIAMGEVETAPLAYAVYESCIKVGAYPQIQFLSEELNRILLKHGNEEQLSWIPEIEAYGMEWADVYFGLRGAHNLDIFWDVQAERLANLRRAMGKISAMRWEKTRWCLVRVPNAALASQAGVDEETITEMFFNACFLDWESTSREWNRWVRVLSQGKRVRVTGRRTDLRFEVGGRIWIVADGKSNMPDGEVATGPIESSVDGEIYFNYPGVLGGRLVNDIHLRWEKGELVESSSTTNQDFLREILKTDPGASRIGEFAIGANPQVKYFCKDILLDEKIGGTVHIALGRAYPNTGATNSSAIHWDIIKDMREQGKIYLDEKLIFENGKMII